MRERREQTVTSEPLVSRRGGFTLLETAMALAIASVLMVVLGNILISSTSSVDYIVVDSITDQEIKKGLNRLLDELQTSSTTVMAVDGSDADHDSATFQTPGAYTGTVSWGAVDVAGVWQTGWSVRYQVVGGELVRRVLNGSGTQVGANELLVRLVDNLSVGQKGFRITVTGPVVNTVIRIRKTFRDNKSYTKELSSSVFLKNN